MYGRNQQGYIVEIIRLWFEKKFERSIHSMAMYRKDLGFNERHWIEAVRSMTSLKGQIF